MEMFSLFLDVFLHLDLYLGTIIKQYGVFTYIILFMVIFLETGLVVTPFLPGDSLIFAAATFAAMGNMNIFILIIVVLIAAILGDAVNYFIGNKLGNKLMKKDGKFIKKSYIDKTHGFYERYGGKTIIIARFVPIVRTFAPFVAGVSNMHYKKFLCFNAIGAIIWVFLVSCSGYFFGNIKFVQEHFTMVVLAIIFISILPAIVGIIKEKSVQKA